MGSLSGIFVKMVFSKKLSKNLALFCRAFNDYILKINNVKQKMLELFSIKFYHHSPFPKTLWTSNI